MLSNYVISGGHNISENGYYCYAIVGWGNRWNACADGTEKLESSEGPSD